jgi:hypothetical protein
VGDAIDGYLAWFKEHRKSIEATEATIAAHIRPVFAEDAVASLTAEDLKAWRDKLARQKARKRRRGYPARQQLLPGIPAYAPRGSANRGSLRRAHPHDGRQFQSDNGAALRCAKQVGQGAVHPVERCWRRVV